MPLLLLYGGLKSTENRTRHTRPTINHPPVQQQKYCIIVLSKMSAIHHNERGMNEIKGQHVVCCAPRSRKSSSSFSFAAVFFHLRLPSSLYTAVLLNNTLLLLYRCYFVLTCDMSTYSQPAGGGGRTERTSLPETHPPSISPIDKSAPICSLPFRMKWGTLFIVYLSQAFDGYKATFCVACAFLDTCVIVRTIFFDPTTTTVSPSPFNENGDFFQSSSTSSFR